MVVGDTEERHRAELDAWWRREPLSFETRDGDKATRFEFSSRGDRVEGWLRLEDTDRARPLIVVVPGSEEGAADPLVAAWAEGWCGRGVGVGCFDLPLHGARRSAKLSAALVDAASDLDRLESDSDRRRLVAEFLLQCRWDLRGALDGLCETASVDARRIACVGVGLGALACAHAAEDDRVNAAVLADLPAGGPSTVAAGAALERFARPALLVGDAAPTSPGVEVERIPRPGSPAALCDAVWPFLEGAVAP